MEHLTQYNKFLIKEELTELFNKYNFKDKPELIDESIDFLLNNDVDGFVNSLFERIEEDEEEEDDDDIINILLDISYLGFSNDNSKLGKTVATFSLPAGWYCPFAEKCLKKVERHRNYDPKKKDEFTVSKKGKKIPYKGDVVVHRGKNSEFDCFSANQEMQYDNVRRLRWHNSDLLELTVGHVEQANLIERSLNYFFKTKGTCEYVRIHESGDFYNKEYFKAWVEVAKRMPDTKFYAYTKAVVYIKEYEKALAEIPNFTITLSYGGTQDKEIEDIDIKDVKVFDRPEDILKRGLLLDLDDSLSKISGGKEQNFALLVHGTQRKGGKSMFKQRNETFANYWKNRFYLNSTFRDDKDSHMSLKRAIKRKKKVQEVLDNIEDFSAEKGIKFTKKHFEDLKKQLNYVIKYHRYDFPENLIGIVPEKYK